MEQTKFVNLPIIGRIQHGERTNNRVVELGHFIAKIDDNYMKAYSQKFNEQYKGKQSIEIEFFNEEPLTIKYARYNQSGEVCYCMADSNEANQKTKNGWQKINCDTFKCQYRQKNEQRKLFERMRVFKRGYIPEKPELIYVAGDPRFPSVREAILYERRRQEFIG